jgi:putative transposase
MKRIAENQKKAKAFFESVRNQDWLMNEMAEVMMTGKSALDQCMMNMGKVLAESVMLFEREQMAGKDYDPQGDYQKWGSQPGSIYLGDQKVKVSHPRLRGSEGEVPLSSYDEMKNPKAFSEEMLTEALRGMSTRKYEETVIDLGKAFGVSPTSISNRLVEATTRKLGELKERDLSTIDLFSMFLDTVHRGGRAFIVALGIDMKGKKHALGFWEGETENKAVCQALLSDLESRSLRLSESVIYVTDGGKGITSSLKAKFGCDLIHQRCTVHKDRNIQHHLPERYRDEAHRRFTNALALKDYDDAKQAIDDFESWLREINESSADSLCEAKEELLTLHRLKVPHLLRKTLHTTNAIESMFSIVRHCEKNVKRYYGSNMSQRWLAAICLYAEGQFRTVRGHRNIAEVVQQIKIEQNKKIEKQAA